MCEVFHLKCGSKKVMIVTSNMNIEVIHIEFLFYSKNPIVI